MHHTVLYIPPSVVQQFVLDVHNDDPIVWKKKKVVVVTTLRDQEITSDA